MTKDSDHHGIPESGQYQSTILHLAERRNKKLNGFHTFSEFYLTRSTVYIDITNYNTRRKIRFQAYVVDVLMCTLAL